MMSKQIGILLAGKANGYLVNHKELCLKLSKLDELLVISITFDVILLIPR